MVKVKTKTFDGETGEVIRVKESDAWNVYATRKRGIVIARQHKDGRLSETRISADKLQDMGFFEVTPRR